MGLAEFNALSREEALRQVLSCAHVDRWAGQVVDGRPYASVDDVVVAVEQSALPWTDAEVDAALARHPRIGQKAAGDAADAAMSRTEQASMDAAEDDVVARIAEGNSRYENRFGHVFLIRAAGRSPQEILAALTIRLQHSPEREREEAARNLREIAALRIAGILGA